jgi:CBS domain-containing protein
LIEAADDMGLDSDFLPFQRWTASCVVADSKRNPTMHCKEIMSHNIQWITPGETVVAAAKLMAFHNLGLLPVCGADGKPIGVLTDRDIALRVIGKDRLASDTVVEAVMTTPVQSVAADCPVERAGELMSKEGVSRLLVLDDDGHLAGLVSVADLLVHAPGKSALATARGVYAREVSAPSTGHPHRASKPTPKYFHGLRDISPDSEEATDNPARIEANSVSHGGTNDLKEFPS